MIKKAFYMVFCEGKDVPRAKHETLLEAQAEAERIAVKMGCATYVLQSIYEYEIKIKRNGMIVRG